MTPSIEREILIDAPVDVVWRTITEPEQITKWFSDQADLDAKPGYQGALTFSDKATHQSMSVRVTVESVEQARLFSYRWMHPEGAEAADGNSVLVEFTLAAEGDGTRLRVSETGLQQLGWPQEQQDGYIREHNQGWVTHFGRLQDYLGRQRTGQGQ